MATTQRAESRIIAIALRMSEQSSDALIARLKETTDREFRAAIKRVLRLRGFGIVGNEASAELRAGGPK